METLAGMEGKFLDSLPVHNKVKEAIQKQLKTHYQFGIKEGVRLGKLQSEVQQELDKVKEENKVLKSSLKEYELMFNDLVNKRKKDNINHKKDLLELKAKLRREKAIKITENDIQKIIMDAYIDSDLADIDDLEKKTGINSTLIDAYIKGYAIPCNEHLNALSIAFNTDFGNYCIKQVGGVQDD